MLSFLIGSIITALYVIHVMLKCSFSLILYNVNNYSYEPEFYVHLKSTLQEHYFNAVQVSRHFAALKLQMTIELFSNFMFLYFNFFC